MSLRTALPVRVGAAVLAIVMQTLAGFAAAFTSMVLAAVVVVVPGEWVILPVMAGSLAVVVAFAAAAIWLQRRSRLITWPIWPLFVLAGFFGFFALIVLTAKGD